jgi:hypothetical protein
LTKKLEKVEKKKAQYDKRLRSLEERLYNQLRLLKDQHAYIKVLESELKALSTIHKLCPQPDNQTLHLSPSQDNTGTTQESMSLEHQNPAEHIEQDPVQSTSPLV